MPLNPAATFPFCPDQTDFLQFRSPDGFAGVRLDLVEGFVAYNSDDKVYPYLTRIHLKNGSYYDAVDSVPELVARFTAVKRLRYHPERGLKETIKENPLRTIPAGDNAPPASVARTPGSLPEPATVPAPTTTQHAATAVGVVPPTSSIWKPRN